LPDTALGEHFASGLRPDGRSHGNLVDTFRITGTPDEHRQKLKELDECLPHVLLHPPHMPFLSTEQSADAYTNIVKTFGAKLREECRCQNFVHEPGNGLVKDWLVHDQESSVQERFAQLIDPATVDVEAKFATLDRSADDHFPHRVVGINQV